MLSPYQKKFKNMKLEDKWGSKVLEFGWTAVPTALFLLQKELELNPTQLNVLLNIILHWWGEDKPHPSQKSIAKRMGVSSKTVQRAVFSLEEKGLISKTRTIRDNPKYRGRNRYDLSPLIKKIEEYIPSIRQFYTK